MDAVKFFEEEERMFGELMKTKYYLFDKSKYTSMSGREKVELVERWSKENPERTRRSDFLSKYPNAACTCGTPDLCCAFLGYREPCCNPLEGPTEDCAKCWDMPLEG